MKTSFDFHSFLEASQLGRAVSAHPRPADGAEEEPPGRQVAEPSFSRDVQKDRDCVSLLLLLLLLMTMMMVMMMLLLMMIFVHTLRTCISRIPSRSVILEDASRLASFPRRACLWPLRLCRKCQSQAGVFGWFDVEVQGSLASCSMKK